jgi:hypothetical protein
MKYFLSVFIVAFLLGCAHTPEDKVKDAVKTFMRSNLDDPGSYQPGEFDIVPVTSEIPEHKRKMDSLAAMMAANKITPRQFSEQDSIITKSYEGEMLQGWNVTHGYRAKNKFGALVSEDADLFVDKNYKVEIKEVR